MAIITDVNIAVSGNKASLSSPVYFYLGDGECTLLLRITKVNIKMGKYDPNTVNIVDEFNAEYARVCILKPNGDLIEKDRCTIGTDEKGQSVVQFVVTKDLIDEASEAGEFALQIHLYDGDPANEKISVNRHTIPPVKFNIETPLCNIGHDKPDATFAIPGSAYVDTAIVGKTEELEVFNENGIYNKTEWFTRDVINASDLNKIETAIWWNAYYDHLVVQNISDLPKVDTTYIAEGTKCFVKEVNDCYFYIDGEWMPAEESFAGVIQNYVKKSDFNEHVANADSTYATKSALKETNDNLAQLNSDLNKHADDAVATYATKTELAQTNENITNLARDLEGDLNKHADDAAATYATKTELAQTNEDVRNVNINLENHKKKAEETYATKKEIAKELTNIEYSESVMLTNAKHQYFPLGTTNVTMTLPTIDINEIYEIHLYVNIGDVAPEVTFTNVAKWQQFLTLLPNNVIEFIFTWLPNDKIWLGGFIAYQSL